MEPRSDRIFKFALKSAGRVTSTSPLVVLKEIGFAGSTRSIVALMLPLVLLATIGPGDVQQVGFCRGCCRPRFRLSRRPPRMSPWVVPR